MIAAAHKEQFENRWYFFTKRKRKSGYGNRQNRAAGNGYWNPLPVVRNIFRAGENNEGIKIGRKIKLAYYKRDSMHQEGLRTDWEIDEYRLDGEDLPHDYSSAGTIRF
ncbi:hypothetical protein POM88_027693 [Heracleum sosnowskyi]|uniref:NAC domain-containing protein n=1 Tax=Heracleum sosnowskyi TaxID=360622 RepID=A0AAD8I898_9APIA|nr:hypothetical protein POM88_027693 [Heracleum sosnowskyi]